MTARLLVQVLVPAGFVATEHAIVTYLPHSGLGHLDGAALALVTA